MKEELRQFITKAFAEHDDVPRYGHMQAAMEFGMRIFLEEVDRRVEEDEGLYNKDRTTVRVLEELRQEFFGSD